MQNLIIYATKLDSHEIRQWINEEAEVTWIIKVDEKDGIHSWKAVNAIDTLAEQEYALWHIGSGPLNVPSGIRGAPGQIVSDPFAGWSEGKSGTDATRPWFGTNLPGPYHFKFMEAGCEAPGSLARSDMSWAQDRYKSIGKPAHPDAMRWWKKLHRFVGKSSVQIPLTSTAGGKSSSAYVFPDAKLQIDQGRHRDVNPCARGQPPILG